MNAGKKVNGGLASWREKRKKGAKEVAKIETEMEKKLGF